MTVVQYRNITWWPFLTSDKPRLNNIYKPLLTNISTILFWFWFGGVVIVAIVIIRVSCIYKGINALTVTTLLLLSNAVRISAYQQHGCRILFF
jgi:hypothetical protein